MWNVLNHPTVRTAIAVGLVTVVAYVGLKCLMALRPSTIKNDTSPSGLDADFKEMQTEGDITQAELRNIKAVLERNRRKS
jgi:hypothetical protein